MDVITEQYIEHPNKRAHLMITDNCKTLKYNQHPTYLNTILKPIPVNIINNIYNTYMSAIDKSILTGEMMYATEIAYLPIFHGGDLFHIIKDGETSFKFIMHNIFETDPNNPFVEQNEY